ncbi:MAG: hypothetical protein ACREKN_05685 [Longimicrobiaceae bacterium]
MLATSVAIHDIKDAEGFVKATLKRSGIRFEAGEFEELVCEGMAILWELAAKYEPHRAGYAQAGRFSGYAARYLPRRLGRSWHRSHREHRLITNPDGSRHWVYGEAPQSFDALPPSKLDRLVRPASEWLSSASVAVATACAPSGA